MSIFFGNMSRFKDISQFVSYFGCPAFFKDDGGCRGKE